MAKGLWSYFAKLDQYSPSANWRTASASLEGGWYSMSHWKIGVKILCSKSWEGQNSMKAKIWGSKFYFFHVEPLVKILCSLKRGVKILYFFPVPWKRGVKTAEPTNQLHWSFNFHWIVLLYSNIWLIFCYNYRKIHLFLSVRYMNGAMMFKQTQTPFDVLGNWPGVEGGGWLW